MPLPPLTAIACTIERANPPLALLLRVTDLISQYLDHSVFWTPPQAVTNGSLSLVDRVLHRVMNDSAVDPAFRRHWLAQSLEVAIRKNDLELVQQLHSWHPGTLNVHSLRIALQYGSLELLLWTIEHRNDRRCGEPGVENLCRTCLVDAVPNTFDGPGPEQIVEWLLDFGIEPSDLWAATSDVRLLEWLNIHGHLDAFELSLDTTTNVLHPNVDAIRFIIDHGVAASPIEVIKWLVRSAMEPQLEPMIDVVVASRLCDSFRDKLTWAAIRPNGHKVLQWDLPFMTEISLHGTGPLNETIAGLAVQYCHADTMEWLWQEGLNVQRVVPSRTPSSEHALLSFYQWLVDKDVDCWSDFEDQVCAARNGYFDVIQWLNLHQSNQLTANTMVAAVANGHMEMVHWLQEHCTEGCDSRALLETAQLGHLDAVQWLCTQYPEGNTSDAIVDAAQAGHLEVVEWLSMNRVDSCNACALEILLGDADTITNSFDVLSWLMHHNTRAEHCVGQCATPFPDGPYAPVSVATEALRVGDVDFARFLFQHARSTFTIDPIDSVISGGHLFALQWLYATAPELINVQQALKAARTCNENKIEAWLQTILDREVNE